jgi:hypothetical protein
MTRPGFGRADFQPVWARSVLAPWWVSWLVSAALTAATLAAVAALRSPSFFTITGWLWGLLAVAGFSLLISASVVFVQRPMRQAYAAALMGLSAEQRTQIGKALRRGELPSDPRVFGAAVRIGTLKLAYVGRALRGWRSRPIAWWVPAILLLAGVLAFVGNDIRQGMFRVGLALYIAAYYAWLRYRKDQLTKHVESLRANADSDAATAGAADALPPTPLWRLIPVLIAIGMATATIAYL